MTFFVDAQRITDWIRPTHCDGSSNDFALPLSETELDLFTEGRQFSQSWLDPAPSSSNLLAVQTAADRASLQCWGVLLQGRRTTAQLDVDALDWAKFERRLLSQMKMRGPLSLWYDHNDIPRGWVLRNRDYTPEEALWVSDLAQEHSAPLLDLVGLHQAGWSCAEVVQFAKLDNSLRQVVLDMRNWLRSASAVPHPAVKALRAGDLVNLGHLESEDLVWACLYGPKTLAAARSNRGVLFDCLPRDWQWRKLLGKPAHESLNTVGTKHFKVKTFLALAQEFGVDITHDLANSGGDNKDAGTGGSSGASKEAEASAPDRASKLKHMRGRKQPASMRGMVKPMAELTRLFGDIAAIKRFVFKSGHAWDARGVHDAGQFSLADSLEKLPQWAALAMKHPQVLQNAADFLKIELAGEVPHSLAAFNKAALALAYPNAGEQYAELASICKENKLSSATFENHLDFWKRGAKPKTAEFCPDVKVLGSEVGFDDSWVFEKLPAASFLGPLLGELTACCQHLSGAGAACARHGVESPYSAFYVVTHQGRVIAQSWAWRAGDNLVFDSVETRIKDAELLGEVFALYARAAHKLIQSGRLGITAVLAGETQFGATPDLIRWLADSPYAHKASKASKSWGLKPHESCSYMDGNYQVLIAGEVTLAALHREKAKPTQKPKNATAARSAQSAGSRSRRIAATVEEPSFSEEQATVWLALESVREFCTYPAWCTGVSGDPAGD